MRREAAILTAWIAGFAALIACRQMDAPIWVPPQNSVLFGVMGPFTGTDSSIGPQIEYGARLAVNEINAAGGVLGHLINVITADDRCEAASGPLAVRTLLQDGAVAIIGGACSDPTISAIESVLLQQSLPTVMLSPAASSPDLTGRYLIGGKTFFFRDYPSDTKQANVLAQQIAAASFTRVNIIYVGTNQDGSPNIYGTGLYQALTGSSGALANNGISVVGTPVNYTVGTTNFTAAQMTQLFSANPQAVILISYPLEGAGITRAIAEFEPSQAGVIRLFGSDATYDSAFVGNADASVIDGMTGTVPAVNPNDPNYRTFAAHCQAATGSPPIYVTASGYDAVYILAYAAIKGGALTSAAMEPNISLVTGGTSPSGATASNATTIQVGEYSKAANILQSGGNISYSGATGNLKLNALGDPTVSTYLVWKVVNNHITAVKTVQD